MMAAPMDVWAHKDDPLGLENCQSAHDTVADIISDCSYCQARNRHCDYFITTKPPHSKINTAQTTNMKFLLTSPTSLCWWTFWPPATIFSTALAAALDFPPTPG